MTSGGEIDAQDVVRIPGLLRQRARPVAQHSLLARVSVNRFGFYPDSTDTSEKPYSGRERCLCPNEENTVPSSSAKRLN